MTSEIVNFINLLALGIKSHSKVSKASNYGLFSHGKKKNRPYKFLKLYALNIVHRSGD